MLKNMFFLNATVQRPSFTRVKLESNQPFQIQKFSVSRTSYWKARKHMWYSTPIDL